MGFDTESFLRLLLVAAFAALAGCDAESGTAAGGVTRDSAGIQIVENSGDGSWAEGEQLSAVEAVSIGRLQGPVEYTFNRIGDVAMASKGRLYVLDTGDKTIKVYDAEGTHLFTFGGAGEGPAEFENPAEMILKGDTLAVYDWGLMKLAYFDEDGDLIRTEPHSLNIFEYGFPSAVASIPGGLAIVLTTGCSMPPPEDLRPKWKLLTMSAGGEIRDTVALLNRRDFLALYGERFCSSKQAFAGTSHSFAVSENGLVAYGDGNEYEISLFNLSADSSAEYDSTWPTPIRIIRHDMPSIAATSAQAEAYRAEQTAPGEDGQIDRDIVEALKAAWDTTDFPESWPAFEELLWDDVGRLWVRRSGPEDAEIASWNLFDSTGAYLGQVDLPANFTVHSVANGMVWGTERDEFDVQYVKGYQLS